MDNLWRIKQLISQLDFSRTIGARCLKISFAVLLNRYQSKSKKNFYLIPDMCSGLVCGMRNDSRHWSQQLLVIKELLRGGAVPQRIAEEFV